jgi:hypothetical protein
MTRPKKTPSVLTSTDGVDEATDGDARIEFIDESVAVGVGDHTAVGDIEIGTTGGLRGDADHLELVVDGEAATVPTRDGGIGLDECSLGDTRFGGEPRDGPAGEGDGVTTQ